VSCGRRARRGGGGGATGEASPQAMSRRHCRMLPQGNATFAGFVVARSARFAGFTKSAWVVCDGHFLRMQIFAIIRAMSRQMIYPDECYAIRGAAPWGLRAFFVKPAKRAFSCATKVAFVTRASDADRRSRRRGDAARRSLLPKRQRSVRGLLTRPSSNGIAASAKAALAARQMRRGSWSRGSANFFPHAKGFVV
jgi:hypothetical protein